MMLLQKELKKVMTLKQKINVLHKLECGESVASVGRHLHINESSVRTIK
jgi:DNA-binding NarL/FixJ family response regulator